MPTFSVSSFLNISRVFVTHALMFSSLITTIQLCCVARTRRPNAIYWLFPAESTLALRSAAVVPLVEKNRAKTG